MNKKVLLFTDWYEPAYKAGGPIQSCKKIVSTFSGDFNFFIITSDRDLGETKPFEGLNFNRWITLGNNVQVCYASGTWLTVQRIRQIVAEVNPSIIYFNSLFSPNFTLKPLWALKKMDFRGRIILAPRGMLMTSALSEKKWKKRIFLSLLSFTNFSSRIIFHATDEREKQSIKQYLGGKAIIHVAPNIPNIASRHFPRTKESGKLNIVYVARIHPVKNLRYTFEVLKAVKNCRQITFDVYGSVDDEKYFQICFEAARQLENRIVINFMGPVENSAVFEILQQYHLFFLPTNGENFGHAIFEALSSGCPVLISDQTPWNDVGANSAGWALPLNDKHEFAEKISEMCNMDGSQYNKMSEAAREYAERFISSSDVKEKYSNLFG